MKKNIVLCALTGIACAAAGYFTCLKVNTDSVEAKAFKVELINTQYDALEKAKQVIMNNDLLDIDGSDEMSDYLELNCRVDSLYRTTM